MVFRTELSFANCCTGGIHGMAFGLAFTSYREVGRGCFSLYCERFRCGPLA
jgi:hypothetical protein